MTTDVVTAGKTGDDDELTAFVATLSDDQRSAIFRTLRVSPGIGSAELATRLDLSPATVRKHLRALIELGMVHVQEREVRRGVQKLYFAQARSIWITEEHDATLSRRQRQRVDLKILRNFVGDAHRAIASPEHGIRPGRVVATGQGMVDARAWQELSELQHGVMERMAAIVDAGRTRQAESGAEEKPVSLVTGLVLLELPADANDEGEPPTA